VFGDLQVLDVVVKSYFEGNMFANKIWTGTVEGPVSTQFNHHIKFNLQLSN
jgi:hypothetical protein